MPRYSIEPRDRIFVKGYVFLSFAKSMGKNIDKNVRGKYNSSMLAPCQKRLDHAKKTYCRCTLKLFLKEQFKKLPKQKMI